MLNLLFFLILIFVTINVVQTWLIFTYKLLIKGGIIIGLIEAVEIPLIIYIILSGEIAAILAIIGVEVIQWLTVAIIGLKR